MPLSLIPQIFFDLIARIIPGAIFLILIYPSLVGYQQALEYLFSNSGKSGIINIWSFFLLIIFAYIIGFILGQLSTLTIGKIRENSRKKRNLKSIKTCVEENNNIRKCFNENVLKIDHREIPPTYVMHDHLRFYSPSEAYRLLKLRAESRLCEVLILGFFILIAMNIMTWFYEPKILIVDRIVFTLLMILGICTLWIRGNTFEMYYVSGTCRLWLFYSFPFESLKKTINDRIKSHPD